MKKREIIIKVRIKDVPNVLSNTHMRDIVRMGVRTAMYDNRYAGITQYGYRLPLPMCATVPHSVEVVREY